MNELEKYIQLVTRLQNNGRLSKEDFKFIAEYTPDPANAKELQSLQEKISKMGDKVPANLSAQSLILAVQQKMQSPEYRDQLLELAQDQEAQKTTSKLSQGLNVLLGANDVVQSLRQIREGEKGLNRNRPGRPGVPGRDPFLQQALREAEISNPLDVIAPVQDQIQDQYLSDLQNAKTASTGQAGAFGAYAQTAANRRRRSARDLAPVIDQLRRSDRDNYNNLLGMRLNETQNMFANQASLYNTDLNQYNTEQQAFGQTAATGRNNLRNALYNLSDRVAPVVGQYQAKNRFKNLFDQLDVVTPGLSDKIAPAFDYMSGRLRYLSPDDTVTEDFYR